jgi:hypothetical protein
LLVLNASTKAWEMAEEVVKPSEWIKIVEYALKAIFGEHVPPYLIASIGALLLLAILIAVLLAILVAIAKAKEIWVEKLRPLSYSPEERKRGRDSRLFANHVLREINQRNLSENWKDEEFAELEAEVEAQGQRRYFLPFRHLFRVPTGIRREPSLTRALERSSERLILLEGDPGSGKSVARRHVAQSIASRTSRARQSSPTLPIFVNLKELTCEEDEVVDNGLVRNFILKSLNRINDRFVDEFLEAEFDRGLHEGRWVFLFDSFDEIPAVLSSVEADETIKRYSDAISDFLAGLNSCRGVVASRFYRGPSQVGWQKFRILELSSDRQDDLIDKALLSPTVAKKLRGDLALASDDIQSVAKNPMLLGLLCEHMRLGNNFPTLVYEVFEKYFTYRFEKDAPRVMQRFNLSVRIIQKQAEQLAFVMASSPLLGLSPTRKLLHNALKQMDFKWSENQLHRLLDALEYMKIGRGDRDGVSSEDRQFTFSHRRFQEYFATCVVVKNPGAVTPKQLLSDARWRETAVVLCQTASPQAIDPLLGVARQLVLAARDQVHSSEQGLESEPIHANLGFNWPDGILHILSILQAGFGSSPLRMPDEIRQAAAEVLQSANLRGNLLDHKFSLEVAGAASERALLDLIRQTLQFDSQWLNDIAYRQVARLSTIPADVLQWVRTAVLRIALGHGSHRKKDALYAHLARLDRSSELLDALRLAYSIRTADLVISLGVCLFLGMQPPYREIWWYWVLALALPAVVLHAILWRWREWETFFLFGCLLRIASFSAIAIALERPLLRAIAIGGIVYLFVWPNAALYCVKSGLATKVLLWPLIPVVPLRSLWQPEFLQILRGIFFQKRTLALFGLYGVVLGAWFFFRETLIGTVVSGLFVAGGGIGIAMFLVGAMLFSARMFADYLRFLRWRRSSQLSIGVNELSTQYHQFRSNFFRFRFLNAIRCDGLLSPSSDPATLVKFAATLDDLRPSDSKLVGVLEAATFRSIAPECRDEVFIMLEGLLRARSREMSGQPHGVAGGF